MSGSHPGSRLCAFAQNHFPVRSGMSEENTNRPTHELKLLDTDTGDTGVVGVAWLRTDGHVSIKLNPGVVLSYDDLKGKYLTLFRVKTQAEWDAIRTERSGRRQDQGYPEYVPKIHFHSATRSDCPNRVRVRLNQVTDDPAKVTCAKCRRAIPGAPAPVVPLPIPPSPEDPPAA